MNATALTDILRILRFMAASQHPGSPRADARKPKQTTLPGAEPLVSALLLLAVALVGCESEKLTRRAWTEDVSIDDRAIVIERTAVLRETNALGGSAYNAVETSATLRFADQPAAPPTWDYPLIPLLLYRDTSGEWVIVATTTSCDTWRSRGKPPSLYWEFRSSGGPWTEVPLSPASIGRRTNLLFDIVENKSKHVTVGDKELLRSEPTIDPRLLLIAGEPPDYGCP